MDPELKKLFLHGTREEIISQLEILPEKDDIFSQTPFFAMSLRKFDNPDEFLEYTDILEKRKIDINTIDIYNQTALFYAAREGNDLLVRYLLNKHANVDHIDHEKQTPLFYAAREGHANTINMLCDSQASVNHVDKNGQTPLFYATRFSDSECVGLLLDRGSIATLKDIQGKTVSAIAKTAKRSKILNVITSHINRDGTKTARKSGFKEYHTKVRLISSHGGGSLLQKSFKRVHTNNMLSIPLLPLQIPLHSQTSTTLHSSSVNNNSWVDVDNNVLAALQNIVASYST